MTTCLKFILGRMKERVGFTLSLLTFSSLNHVEIKPFPHMHFLLKCEADFFHLIVFQAVDLHKRSKESKQPMYRRLIHTPLDVENIQEVRRPNTSRNNSKIMSHQPQHVLMYLLFPYRTSQRGSTRALRSSGLTLSLLFTTQPFCTEVRRMNHSHECDLWNSLCALHSSVSLTNSTFSVNSQQRSDRNCKTSLQRHMPRGQTEQTVGILSLFKALDKHS